MKFVILLAVLVFASKLDSEKQVSRWTDILQDKVFESFMTLVTGGRLHIILSPRCLTYHGPYVRGFLKQLPFAPRISTKHEQCDQYGYCHHLSHSVGSLLLIWCERHDMSKELMRIPFQNAIVLLSDEVRDEILSVKDAVTLKDPNYTYVHYRGVYIVSRSDSRILLTKDRQVECLSCREDSVTASWKPRLLEQLPINGVRLTISCKHPSLCDHPTYAVLLDILNYKNASFREEPYTLFAYSKRYSNGTYTPITYEVVIMDEFSPQWYMSFPMKIQPRFYHSSAFIFFAKRRHPLPKGVVLILPFSSHVWTALLCGMLLSAFTISLMLWADKKTFFSAHTAALALVASLLQQSNQLSYNARRQLSRKLVIALWSFMGLVIATGYKSSLTALLRDVPLETIYPTFTSSSCSYHIKCADYLLEFKEFGSDTLTKEASEIMKADFRREEEYQKAADNGHFPQTNGSLGRHTSTIREKLRNFEYVPTGDLNFGGMVGPEIVYASQFREAFAQTVGQAQECGLFSRAEALEEFKVKYQSYSVGVSTGPEVLTLSDFVPFFLIWSAGVGAGVVILLLEVAWAYFRAWCVKPRQRNIQVLFKKPGPFRRRKQMLDIGQRWAY